MSADSPKSNEMAAKAAPRQMALESVALLLASALFCGGTASKFDVLLIRRGVLGLGLAVFVFAAAGAEAAAGADADAKS